jgi:hypothetical protein
MKLTLSLCNNKEITEERSRGVARGDNNRKYLNDIHLYYSTEINSSNSTPVSGVVITDNN